MALEQARGAAGPAADQYALGRTLLEMLAGGTVAEDSLVAVAQLPGGLPGALDSMVGVFMQAHPKVISLLLASFADARPADLGTTSRCLVLVGDDDPDAPAEAAIASFDGLNFPVEKVEHLVWGRHMPHVTRRDLPEITARNVEELAHHAKRMPSSSREGTPLSTAIASTVFEVSSRVPTSGPRSTEPPADLPPRLAPTLDASRGFERVALCENAPRDGLLPLGLDPPASHGAPHPSRIPDGRFRALRGALGRGGLRDAA